MNKSSTPQQHAQAQFLYEQGHSLLKIALELGFRKETIKAWRDGKIRCSCGYHHWPDPHTTPAVYTDPSGNEVQLRPEDQLRLSSLQHLETYVLSFLKEQEVSCTCGKSVKVPTVRAQSVLEVAKTLEVVDRLRKEILAPTKPRGPGASRERDGIYLDRNRFYALVEEVIRAYRWRYHLDDPQYAYDLEEVIKAMRTLREGRSS